MLLLLGVVGDDDIVVASLQLQLLFLTRSTSVNHYLVSNFGLSLFAGR